MTCEYKTVFFYHYMFFDTSWMLILCIILIPSIKIIASNSSMIVTKGYNFPSNIHKLVEITAVVIG